MRAIRPLATEGFVPRYYIDTDDGDVRHHDEDGHDLPDPEAARRAAIAALPDMARDRLPDGDQRTFSARVRDQDGVVLYSVELALHGEWQAPRAT